jgi:hypothetical protein
MEREQGSGIAETARVARTLFARADVAFLCLIALLPVVAELLVTIRHLKSSWDDGAITAAFAQTLAHSGRIALTPTSVTVEGFSSITWFLLLSVPAFVTHHPEVILAWMKALSALFAALSLVVFYGIARRQFAARSSAVVAVLLFAFSLTVLNEIRDGMEMNLATFLLLLLFHILTREQDRGRVLYASLVGWLLLLTRFEAPLQLGLLAIGLLCSAYLQPEIAAPQPGTVLKPMAHGAKRKDIFLVGVLIVVGFVLIEVWRHDTFGVWMPNTVYAKRFAPYSERLHSMAAIRTRWSAFQEPFSVLEVPFVAAALAAFLALGRKRFYATELGRMHPAVWTLAGGCFFVGGLIGVNWGYSGRMASATIPFLILALVGICADATRGRRLLQSLFALVLLAQSGSWLMAFRHPVSLVHIDSVEPIGRGADSIRLALHKEHLVSMISDVGGPALCCEKLTVLDSGLLANPELSHTGWEGFDRQFYAVNPELVETHTVWAADSHIYESGLLDQYSMVAADGRRFFVRDDLYRQLMAEHAGLVMPVQSVPACMSSLDYAPDAAFSMTKHTCLVLNETN